MLILMSENDSYPARSGTEQESYDILTILMSLPSLLTQVLYLFHPPESSSRDLPLVIMMKYAQVLCFRFGL